jgi:hypothetical protein
LEVEGLSGGAGTGVLAADVATVGGGTGAGTGLGGVCGVSKKVPGIDVLGGSGVNREWVRARDWVADSRSLETLLSSSVSEEEESGKLTFQLFA